MARKYFYSAVISNAYLGLTKEVKGVTREEVDLKAAEQIRKWDVREKRERERARIADLKEQAEFDTDEAKLQIQSYKEILQSTLAVDDTLDWNALKRHDGFPELVFDETEPTLEDIAAEMGVSLNPGFLEKLFGFGKASRLEKVDAASSALTDRHASWEVSAATAERAHQAERDAFQKKQQDHNEEIDALRDDFEQAHGSAIEKYVYLVLERSQYPDGLERDYEVEYDPLGENLIVSFDLPPKEAVPRVIQQKFIASRKVIEPVDMKQKEFDTFYEDVLHQICLRTIHEVFESVQLDALKSVVFNGWISGTDSRTGKSFRSCIMSCLAGRELFEDINLELVTPKDCYGHLKGLSAGPLAELAPIRPIMDLRREDKRFRESQDVLEALDSSANLIDMDWKDFEHLVRELFEQVFEGEGKEVKVTQASRDGGVDAIAFDPDPIRGGKFVIQAKRYSNVVPVAAVRELYGTMINEGASKGILVTTSHFGNDAREFAKDKPISLIDGSNLVYMLGEYGHDVKIDIPAKR